MGFELPNGKTARNLQEQVKFLSEKLKDLYAAVNEIGIRVLVVSELPEEGKPLTIYFVPSEDASQKNIYDEYMWIEDEWELIGTTQIDLSGYAELSGNNDFIGTNTFKSLSTVSHDGTQDAHFEVADNGNVDLKNNTNYLMSFTSTNYVVYNHLRPRRETYNLGDPDYRWRDLYLNGTINLQNPNYSGTHSQIFESQYGRLFFKTDGSNAMEIQSANIVFSRTLLGNNLDLGSSSYKWRDLYLSRNLSDGTNTVSIADLAALITYAKGQGWIS